MTMPQSSKVAPVNHKRVPKDSFFSRNGRAFTSDDARVVLIRASSPLPSGVIKNEFPQSGQSMVQATFWSRHVLRHVWGKLYLNLRSITYARGALC